MDSSREREKRRSPRCRLRLAHLASVFAGISALLWATGNPSVSIPTFRDVAAEAGIDSVNVNGSPREKNYIPETKGGGAGFFDFDNDGWMDLLLVQGCTLEEYRHGKFRDPELYRNRGDGTFEAVSSPGLAQRGWGMGVTFGDYDNDGWTDLYLTNVGPNRLFRNLGDGSFADVTDQAGVGFSGWSTSSSFGDYDNDGDLDLYVANYVFLNFDSLPPKACRHREAIVLCGPMGLQGEQDILYRNNGDGTFTDVSRETGAYDSERLYGLGVVWADVDNDGDLDLYVANDATPNLLFVNRGDGTFEELGLLSGLAVNSEGRDQASMGVDFADYDNDGWLDAYMTHFSDDYSTLYRNEGELQFRDVTARADVLEGEIGLVSWGTRFYDFNLDGWKDIFHSNGHVYPYLVSAGLDEKYQQPETLFINRRDGTFSNATTAAGAGFSQARVSRGVAFSDYDRDGDIDFLVVHLNDKPSLYRNDIDSGNWVAFRVRGRTSNRDGLGARIVIRTGELTQHWEIKRGGSIYSAHDPTAHFGIGSKKRIDAMEIRWPSGVIQEFENLEPNQYYWVDETEGLHRGAVPPAE